MSADPPDSTRRPTPPDDVAGRAAVHAALGEPNRLRIVDALATTDLTPGALARSLGIPGNLLAHHLDSLESVGLVRRIRSAGDRRRRYVSLTDRGATFASVTSPAPRRPLFVCTHNSARSQLAAVVWNHRTGGDAASAGTHPADHVHPGAVAAAARVGLDLTAARPRLLESRPRAEIVTVCDRAYEELATDTPPVMHWSLPDPADPTTPISFDEVVAELTRRVGLLLRTQTPRPSGRDAAGHPTEKGAP